MAGDRDAFLSRVRDAVARGRHYPVRTIAEFPLNVGYVGAGPDVVQRLAAEFEAVGGKVHRAASDEEARVLIRNILVEHRTSIEERASERVSESASGQEGTDSPTRLGAAASSPPAIRWQHPLLERIGIDSVLEEAGFEVVPWSELESADADLRRQHLFTAAVGVSSVDWAVAETGTLVVAARPGRGRSVSLLPPLHVAVVERAQILPDLFDLFAKLGTDPSELPSNVVLITGPSKTGDIELKLTTGVHGPGEVHLVILDKESSR